MRQTSGKGGWGGTEHFRGGSNTYVRKEYILLKHLWKTRVSTGQRSAGQRASREAEGEATVRIPGTS